MKKGASITGLLLSITCFSQVVFSPSGAEWRYLFAHAGLGPTVFYNEKISYRGDSVLGSETVKVLDHVRAFSSTNMMHYGPTLIRQNGDTVFMRNITTDHKWQVLYNYAAQPGQGWQNVLITSTYTSADTVTFTYTVTAKTTVNISGRPHLQLLVDGQSSDFPGYVTTHTITGRFGSHDFLFLARCNEVSDGDSFAQRLCYQDDTVGLHSFSNLPCSYQTVGHAEGSNVVVRRIFPNPASDKVYIETRSGYEDKVALVDLRGQVFIEKRLADSAISLDLTSIPEGAYVLVFYSGNAMISCKKLLIARY